MFEGKSRCLGTRVLAWRVSVMKRGKGGSGEGDDIANLNRTHARQRVYPRSVKRQERVARACSESKQFFISHQGIRHWHWQDLDDLDGFLKLQRRFFFYQ